MVRPANSRPRSQSSRRSGETALGWLGLDMRGAGVLATARMHLQIQQAVAAILPPGLGAVCVVARLESQRLQLAVPGPAHAAKLRQLAPRIAQALAAQGWNLNEISVKVQAGMPRPGAKAPRPPKLAQPLGPTALDAFESLGRNVRPGPLADAIARLLQHHKGE
ncbi:flagellar hook-length control protein FliK [Bordetella genomosp. 13]|uniref:Flagellar hook-length control protein FliK n=2 Tax=Bordetella genomosp. 13 TaxID=463040 RepID=A0A1W6ZGA3_9BORD|nr:flagellar hook-length control protein FliK [Bordetella genomosp. 13]